MKVELKKVISILRSFSDTYTEAADDYTSKDLKDWCLNRADAFTQAANLFENFDHIYFSEEF